MKGVEASYVSLMSVRLRLQTHLCNSSSSSVWRRRSSRAHMHMQAAEDTG